MFHVPNTIRVVSIISLLTLAACGTEEEERTDVKSVEDTSPNETAGNSGILSRPSITTTQMGNSIVVYWNVSNASEYRIFYWQGSEVPQQVQYSNLENLEYTTPSLQNFGEYTVIVEAYDELGNSLFSEPSVIEVI